MNKLQHSVSATKRALQISRYQLFVFVEGRSDKYFYGEICSTVCNSKLQCKIYGVNETPFCKDETPDKKLSGKSGLLTLFACFQKGSLLTLHFEREKKVTVFFLDKDIDDLLGKKLDSEHLIYTKYYDVENHIFMEGDVIKGAACATSMTTLEVHEKILNPQDWMFKVATQWKLYVKLCFFAMKTGERKEVQECYGIHTLPPIAPSDESNFLSDQVYLEYSTLLDNLYDKREHNSVFKGKWYADLLERELVNAEGKKNKAGKHEEILKCIQATLNFSATWAEHFKQPLNRLLAKINL